MFDRNFFIGLGIGVVAGFLGMRYVSQHRELLQGRLGSLGDLGGKIFGGENQEMTVEEMEAQKERLEDLIAEAKNRQQA